MVPRRLVSWVAGVLLGLPLLLALLIMLFGWNWLRGPIERLTLERTGRVLIIGGDIAVQLGWPAPRLRAGAIQFANPAWAREPQMLTADGVEVAVNLPHLLRGEIVLPEVSLRRPVVFLERGSDGRRNWLLDREQSDEEATVRIDRLTLDRGQLGYDDLGQKTSIRSELSSTDAPTTAPGGRGVVFSAIGRYKGLPLAANGTGGSVLGLRDEDTPYPLWIELKLGPTSLKADGSITSLLRFSAMDMRVLLRGGSLAQLFPLIGMALPETRAYVTEGRMLRRGQRWTYRKFTGRVGASDIAGLFEVDTSGARPAIQADLISRRLDLADLGALIGAQSKLARSRSQQAVVLPAATAPPLAERPGARRVLPVMLFDTGRWDSVDAEVRLSAGTIQHAGTLPLKDLTARLSLRNEVLTLDPLEFVMAGGRLQALITLDGRDSPIKARARVHAKDLMLALLVPSTGPTGAGRVNAEVTLAGSGDSVSRMLASASGKLELAVDGGEISQLMMEKAGLHLWEILRLSVTGDRLIKLRCGVADFVVKEGVMTAATLLLDTEVTTIVGSGSIDLRHEKLDLTLRPKTRNTSPLALQSPLHLRGTFANPEFGVDKGRVAVRALGAVALGLVNPLLALIPLVDPGPGREGDCAHRFRVGAMKVQR